jgi:serine/threonine protein kinase
MSVEKFKEVGYTLLEQLFDGRRTVVWRARRTKDNLPVVLKFAKQRVADLRLNKQLESEYYLISSKLENVQGVICAVDLLKIDDESVFVLVLEDFGGSSLGNYIPMTSIEAFLKFAIKVTSSLSEVHQRKVIHRDIKVIQI